MDFDSTARFNSDISNLTKKPKDGYSSVRKDIADIFEKVNTFEAACKIGDCIRLIGKSLLIKVRIRNSGNSIGSSGGFRLIMMANPNTETITLCHVYPKRGKLSKPNVSSTELAAILKELGTEKASGVLLPVDFLGKKANVPR